MVLFSDVSMFPYPWITWRWLLKKNNPNYLKILNFKFKYVNWLNIYWEGKEYTDSYVLKELI